MSFFFFFFFPILRNGVSQNEFGDSFWGTHVMGPTSKVAPTRYSSSRKISFVFLLSLLLLGALLTRKEEHSIVWSMDLDTDLSSRSCSSSNNVALWWSSVWFSVLPSWAVSPSAWCIILSLEMHTLYIYHVSTWYRVIKSFGREGVAYFQQLWPVKQTINETFC